MPPKTNTKRQKKKLPCDLDVEFLDQIKDAVVFLQRGPEPTASIRSFVEDACRRQLKAVKRKHRDLLTDGEIPNRPAAPRQGRPMH